MHLSPAQTAAIATSLSPVRLGTYLVATGFSPGATALDIYVWNALVSGAFFSSLHICEVVMRNGIAHALLLKYGSDWPWDAGFGLHTTNRFLPTHWTCTTSASSS